jgi:alkylation response protein AidB-like acyl-CoA dehydrogenase
MTSDNVMTHNILAWGGGTSDRFESFAEQFRPTFAKIRATAVDRDLNRRLPHDEVSWLKEGGLTVLRLPEAAGGFAVTLPELFGLLVELSAADSNLTNILRPHIAFTEDVLNSENADWAEAWTKRLGTRALVGNGFSEIGDAKVGSWSTRLVQEDDGWVLNGSKYYTTGSLFADWINLGGNDQNGEPVGAVVPRHAQGVTIVDDWDGFGQTLTASGTAHFQDVAVSGDLVNPPGGRFKYATAFFQLVHLATLAGIGRAASEDVARLVAERTRIYSHGNASQVSQDPQILQVVGRVRSAAYAARAIVLQGAHALQRAFDARRSANVEEANAVAELEINQSVTIVSNLILDATTILFDALGSSAIKRGNDLDRYWRNARTLTSHNPRIYRDRIVGDFAVNGTLAPGKYTVGQG